VGEPRSDLRDALAAFVLAFVSCVALGLVARVVPFASRNLGALVAIVFLYVPVFYAWRRSEDLYGYGFRAAPVGRGLAVGLGYVAIVFPLFAVAYVGFYDVVCHPHQAAWLRHLALPGKCPRWRGWAGVRAPAFDLDFLKHVFIQVVVTALPEELFFRGFLHHLLERRWPPRRRFLGGGIGLALVVSSALFALAHVAIWFDPHRLAVFFPGLLFGWMRSATGSIMAGTIAHASSNLFIDVLDRMFF
jgi:membrane protease YdiL (CAAX protease family)